MIVSAVVPKPSIQETIADIQLQAAQASEESARAAARKHVQTSSFCAVRPPQILTAPEALASIMGLSRFRDGG